jgi:plasmid stabilization system protein ParE
LTFRVEFTDAATGQAEEAGAWWRANRPAAPELFDSELAYALDLLARMPPPTQVWGQVEGKPVRKVRLPRTGHALYFTIEDDLVTVHALWHGARGSGPPLP